MEIITFVTKEEAAKILGVSLEEFLKMKVASRNIFYDRSEITELARKRDRFKALAELTAMDDGLD